MKKNRFFSCMILLIILLSSCNVVRVTTVFSDKSVPKVDEMVLLSTYIGKIKQPVLPLIDAAAFNGKTNKIADEIIDAQDRMVDSYRENIAENIKKYFNCEVLYGDDLSTLDGMNYVREKYDFKNSLFVENDNFPKMHIASGDVNPFKFSKGKVIQFFNDADNFKSTVVDICKNLGIDYMAVSYSQLDVFSTGMFGMNGSIRLDSYLYIFDKYGDLVATGKAFSKYATISGTKPDDYQMKLEDFSIISDPLASKTAVKFVSE